jgi:hypothetical protein
MKVCNYVCYGEKDGLFSFPIEWSYHFEIKSKGDPIGREIEYDTVFGLVHDGLCTLVFAVSCDRDHHQTGNRFLQMDVV